MSREATEHEFAAIQPLAFGKRSRVKMVLRTVWRNRTGAIGALILIIIGFGAIAAPWLARVDPAVITLTSRLTPPSWLLSGSPEFLLGTDHLGRDLFSRILYGGRISLAIGIATTILACALGTLIGMTAGYFKGRFGLLMRLADVQQSFPFIALAIALVAAVGPGIKTTVLALGIGGWVLFARVVHGQVLSVRTREYIEAARAIGASDLRIMLRHILPNISSVIIVLVSFAFPWMIVVEASLSFLGFGVQPPQTTWGLMLSESRDYIQVAWWLPTFPGLAIVATVLGTNLLGDWLRDVLDPNMRNV